jgi:hypothetical protein
MSNTDTYTNYVIEIMSPDAGGNVFTLSSSYGVTDAMALAIATYLHGMTWPTGTTFSMQKDVVTYVSYNVDFSVNPLAFT